MTITLRDLAWVTGFLEGEGSFQCKQRPKQSIRVNAVQVQRQPLERLVALLGGSIKPRRPGKPTHSPCHTWELRGPSAAGLMMTLFTEMSPRRRGQIKRALAEWRKIGFHPGKRPRCPKGHEYSPAEPYRTRNDRSLRVCVQCRRNNQREFARLKRRAAGIQVRVIGRKSRQYRIRPLPFES